MIARIVIENIRPSTPTRAFPAKAVEGETIPVSADIFRDGHDVLAAQVRWRRAGERSFRSQPMTHVVNDEWSGVLFADEIGALRFQVRAWTDAFATWSEMVGKKLAAGQDVELELQEGALLLGSVKKTPSVKLDALRETAAMLRDPSLRQTERFAAANKSAIRDLMYAHAPRPDLSSSGWLEVIVDRRVSLYGAWYEFFPRSEGGLAGATKRLDAIAEMGFDVVYLPPIHPIGTTDRKGKNNSTKASPGDPGSPWAIGSKDGGHTSIDPDLGTFDDFSRFIEEADDLGIQVALDYALQCSPDHPWVNEHPEWFLHRPDGSIRYAENPPKKYQDIYPIDLWTDTGRTELWNACRDILLFWIERGIKIFRVDNPHTKTLAFWEWLISEIRSDHPDVVLLAEAFTAPKMMSKLAEVGFNQSYTYFTWRNTKHELTEYVGEVALGPKADYMRPTFWTNTPDILSGPLRKGSKDAFKMRLVLAATLVPSYGMYSGYELCENLPASNENEEYLNSEKYEVKARDWDRKDSLVGFVTRINDIRRRHLAFRWLRNITFHHADNPNVLVYSKTHDGDSMLMVVNLSPDATAESTVWLDLGALGPATEGKFEAYDELTGQTFVWRGSDQYIRLDPGREPAHILHIRHAGAGAEGSIVSAPEEGRPPELWKG